MNPTDTATDLDTSAYEDAFGEGEGADGAMDESYADDFGGGSPGEEDFAGDGMEGDAWDAGDDLMAADQDGFDGEAWQAFEEEVADALDTDDADEFLGRIMGGLSRVGGMLGGGARGAARGGRRGGRGGGAAPAGRGAPAGANPLGAAAQGLARLLGGGGAPGGAAGAGGGIAALLGRLMGQGADDFEAFDEMVDAYEDGVDEALPAIVGLAARGLARGLGHRNVGQLGNAARRALVRGVATATRTLVNRHGPHGARAAGRLSTAAGRAARRGAAHPQQAAQRAARGLPRVAQRVAQQGPRTVRRLARPLARGPGRALTTTSTRSAPPRVGTAGPGVVPTPVHRIRGDRVLRLRGPVDIVIRQR